MKKYYGLLAAVFICANLSGCAGSSDGAATSESFTESSKAQTSGEPTFLTGLDGEKILTSEITEAFGESGAISPEELTEENFGSAVCAGFVYAAPPSEFYRNDRDNSEVFNEADMTFTDSTGAEPLKNYERLNVGDKVGSLTLTKAETSFSRDLETRSFTLSDGSEKTGAQLGLPEIFFAGGKAEFDGELTMKGYLCRIAADDYGVSEGELLFVPSEGADIPVLSYCFDGGGFYHAPRVYSFSGLVWQNEFGYMTLGNAADTSADVSSLPKDGSFVKAEVTVCNIEMSSGVNFTDRVKAELVRSEVLS